LTYWALTGEPGRFAFEKGGTLPPMFQAFPLQISLPALAVEGARLSFAAADLERLGPVHFVRQAARGGNVDRAGLSPSELRVHATLDGADPLSAVATRLGLPLAEVGAVALGFEIAGQAERRSPAAGASILLLEDDAETVRIALRVLGPEGDGYHVRHVRDRVAAKLLVRRNAFSIVMLPIDNADQEAFYHSFREHAAPTTRFVGVLKIEEERQLDRLDALGLDGVIHRPVTEPDLRATVRQLLGEELAAVS
jgi:CheY-like chemotaxis protein